MKARSRAASSSTSRSTTPTLRRNSDAARWVGRVGIATLFPVSDVVLPSLWERVAGRRDVDWAVRDEDGRYVSFTPEMDRCWRWKDELPERGLACVGKHLGRWAALVAPRLVPALHAVSAERRDALGAFELELVEAVRTEGPATGPQLRALLGARKPEVDKAVVSLQRALVLTGSGLVEQRQGWGAVAFELVSRRWPFAAAPAPEEARRELAGCVLASSGELSAADLGGALGWRVRRAGDTLAELADRGEARVRREGALVLYRPSDRVY